MLFSYLEKFVVSCECNNLSYRSRLYKSCNMYYIKRYFLRHIVILLNYHKFVK